MFRRLPAEWHNLLAPEFDKVYFQELIAFLVEEQQRFIILPDNKDIFAAFEATNYSKVKVVILGQDPYPTPGHAHGLAFSVDPDLRPLPGSLRNIFKELTTDISGFQSPPHGYLRSWAEQGVFLLNTVLTVRAHEANSHQKKGWEKFTDRVITHLNHKADRVVFVLWGKKAQAKTSLITAGHHKIVATAHPSPLSVKLFLGSRPFSQINKYLLEAGLEPINWQLPREV